LTTRAAFRTPWSSGEYICRRRRTFRREIALIERCEPPFDFSLNLHFSAPKLARCATEQPHSAVNCAQRATHFSAPRLARCAASFSSQLCVIDKYIAATRVLNSSKQARAISRMTKLCLSSSFLVLLVLTVLASLCVHRTGAWGLASSRPHRFHFHQHSGILLAQRSKTYASAAPAAADARYEATGTAFHFPLFAHPLLLTLLVYVCFDRA
jgi:hypothetical protein